MKTLELALLSLNQLVSIIQFFCYGYDESHDHDNNANMAKYKDLDPPSLVLSLQYLNPLMPDGLSFYLLDSPHHYLTRLSYLQAWPIYPKNFMKIHSMPVASISPALSCSPQILYFRWP